MRFILILALTLECFAAGDPAGSIINRYLKSKPPTATKPEITKKDRIKFENLMRKIVARSLFERKKSVSKKVLQGYKSAYQGHGIYRVYGTSFGKPGNKGESNVFKDGSPVKRGIIAAALPDNSAVGKTIRVRRILKNGKKTRWVKMLVRDLGPWFRDDPYWKKKGSPRAVAYFKNQLRRWDGRVVKNPAGIDLTPWAWQRMGVGRKESANHSGYVEWKFN